MAGRLACDYEDSRRRFRELAAAAGAALHVFPVRQEQAMAPALFTDVARLGSPHARALIVIASGTHGVEGYAGAACQFHFLHTYVRRFAGSEIAFLLVHAVNPWGYAHDSRVTEEGIDLNRNFCDFPLTSNMASAYGGYHRLLIENYRPLPRGLFNELKLLSHGLTAQRRRSLQAAITAGQHDVPDGMFYGGQAPAKSRIVWEEIMHRFVTPHPLALLVDIHTGLGKRGSAEWMSDLPKCAPEFQTLYGWLEGRLTSMAQGESVSAALSGTLSSAFIRLGGGRRYALGLEFGTCAPLTVLNALRADQWLRNHQSKPSWQERQRVQAMMRRAFAPSDSSWAEQAVVHFERALMQIVQCLGKTEAHTITSVPIR